MSTPRTSALSGLDEGVAEAKLNSGLLNTATTCRLAAVVDFEVFRGPLIVALRRSVRGKGGRPPFDPVMMFKILVL